MRSWSLLFSALCASITSVLSLVLPFCLFLNFYHGDLFVAASERTAQRGIEVMLYITPFLMFIAFMSFWLIFRYLKQPHKIFEIQRFFNVMRIFAAVWFCLIFLFQFLDGRMGEIVESVLFGVISLSIFSIPLLVGIWSGNYMYFNSAKIVKINMKMFSKQTIKPL